jgi:hypothetical protein
LFEKYTSGIEAEVAAALQSKPVSRPMVSAPELRWSQLQTAEFVASFLQLGMLIQVGLAIFARNSLNAKSAELAETLAAGLPQLRDEVASQVREAYANVHNELVKEWSKRHEEELRGQLEDIKQAAKLRESGEGSVAEARTRLTAIHELIDAQKAFLSGFKPKVWAGIESSEAPADAG